ncbi:MAG: hypothetical protein LBM13_01740, partial [Candidatus Ancillula sp.]|nr:hypothetical protein [Candidatus Ancillula sp.]
MNFSNRLQLSIQPLGSGKTSQIVDFLVDHFEDNVITLTANRFLADDLRDQVAKKLVNKLDKDKAYKSPDIRTFQSLMLNIIQAWETKKDIPEDKRISYLSGPEQSECLTTVAKEVLPEPLFNNFPIEELRNLVYVVNELDITVEEIKKWAKEKDIDIWELCAEIYEKYVEKLKNENKVDNSRMGYLAQHYLADLKELLPDLIIIDDLNELSPSVMRFVDWCLSNTDIKFWLSLNIEGTTQTYRGNSIEWVREWLRNKGERIELNQLENAKENIKAYIFQSEFDQYQFVVSQVTDLLVHNSDLNYDDFAVIA